MSDSIRTNSPLEVVTYTVDVTNGRCFYQNQWINDNQMSRLQSPVIMHLGVYKNNVEVQYESNEQTGNNYSFTRKPSISNVHIMVCCIHSFISFYFTLYIR